MAVTLASSSPITEEHTKLLDHLSKPLSQLIHRISHPLEEDISAKVVTSCFICIWVHGFASCVPTFSKQGSLSHYYCQATVSEVKLPSNTGWFSTHLPCRLCTSVLQWSWLLYKS